jgi:hypothetical protein
LLEAGGTAEILDVNGESAVLRAPVAAPPGSTLSATPPGDSWPVRVKVRACRRVDGDGFRIEGRLIDLTRDQRARLAGTDGH